MLYCSPFSCNYLYVTISLTVIYINLQLMRIKQVILTLSDINSRIKPYHFTLGCIMMQLNLLNYTTLSFYRFPSLRNIIIPKEETRYQKLRGLSSQHELLVYKKETWGAKKWNRKHAKQCFPLFGPKCWNKSNRNLGFYPTFFIVWRTAPFILAPSVQYE